MPADEGDPPPFAASGLPHLRKSPLVLSDAAMGDDVHQGQGLRVLHVAESVKGGCGTYLNEVVAEQLRSRSTAAVRVIVPDAHAAQITSVAPQHLRLFASPGRSAAALRALADAIRDEVRTFRPDIVHLHSTFAGLIGRPLLATMRPRPRVIYCAHGWAFDMDRAGWKLKAMALAERVLAPLADRIIAISDYERQRGLEIGIDSNRIVTVLNGIADRSLPPSPLPTSGPRRRLLFIGRLDRQKGFDTLLSAIEDLGDAVELRVVGAAVADKPAGPDGGGRPLPRNVVALGWQSPDRIAEELAGAELLVVPSRWEGFGLVALEAMRAGRAVLASRVGGLPEVVEDEVTGHLVEPDDPAAWRAAILGYDRATLARHGAAGRARYLDHFTVGRTVSSLEAVYRDCVGG